MSAPSVFIIVFSTMAFLNQQFTPRLISVLKHAIFLYGGDQSLNGSMNFYVPSLAQRSHQLFPFIGYFFWSPFTGYSSFI